jgi:predicted methyltransferase
MRTIVIRLLLIASIGAAITACQSRRAEEAQASSKVQEIVAFIALKQGDKVADIVGNRLTGSLAEAVGPSGRVYAVETAQVARLHPELLYGMKMLAMRFPNIVVSAKPVAAPLPRGLDAVVIRQNYHDLYDKHMAPVNVALFNKGVFTALKPGGIYVVLDHAALAGSGISATETLHRIDPARVKADVLAAGFTWDAASSILANPDDDHTKSVFNRSMRGRTDQFLFRFRKPM